jgi:hypothetical protein
MVRPHRFRNSAATGANSRWRWKTPPCSARAGGPLDVSLRGALAFLVAAEEQELPGVRARQRRTQDVAVLRDRVDDPRVPVVEGRGQVHEEDDRDAALRPQLAVDEGDAVRGDGARRRIDVRRDRFALHIHDRSP